MRAVANIWRRELLSLFAAAPAYVVLAVFLGLAGFFFYNILVAVVNQTFLVDFRSQQFGGPPPPIDVPSIVLRGYLGIAAQLLLFLMPLLTMSSLAEERRRGTMELLLTSPLGVGQLVLGKFLAVLAVIALMIGITFLFPLLLATYTKVEFVAVAAGYGGLLLLSGGLAALGLFVSSLTDSQVIAAVLGFGLMLLLGVIHLGGEGAQGAWGELLKQLSVFEHFQDLAKGVVDSGDVVFYLSLIALGLFLTYRSVETLRWRG
ncbi:MAG: ABC transporter permease subunit [Deinococcus sp.]|nr:ABC transporter permease subunit [Deinococcus sp.]